MNGTRFLEKETVEDIYAPHTQLESPYYNLWVSGGYECTHLWADLKQDFVGVIFSQNNAVRNPGYEMNDKFKGLLYEGIFEGE